MQQTVEIQTTPKGTFITIPNHDSYIDYPDFNVLSLNVDLIDGVGEVFEKETGRTHSDTVNYQFSLFFNGSHVNVVFGQKKEKEAHLYWKSIHEVCIEGKVGGEVKPKYDVGNTFYFKDGSELTIKEVVDDDYHKSCLEPYLYVCSNGVTYSASEIDYFLELNIRG